MTKLILLAMMFLTLVEGGAQHVTLRVKADENEVPKRVVSAFKEQYRNVIGVSWAIISSTSLEEDFGIREKRDGERSTFYDVTFSATDGRREVVYDHFGHSVGVKEPVTTASLPPAVTNAVKRSKEHAQIVSAQSVTEGAAQPSCYQIVISDEGIEQSMIVRASGELIKKN